MFVLPALALAAAAALPSPLPMTAPRAHAIDAIGRAELRANSTPGLAIGVVEDGLLVYARGFGYADRARKIRVTPSTKFFAGGITEQFTAAAVFLLAQDKKLTIHDRVSRYVPELSSMRDLTIAQLLSHTSGLPQLSDVPGNWRDVTRPLKLEDVLHALGRAKPWAAPGTQFRKNALDYAVAALIVQRVSGEPFSSFLQTRIFEPLIMTSTFVAGDQGGGTTAHGYTHDGRRFAIVREPDPSWLFGSGDLITNVNDLAKWDIGLPLILNVDSLRAMWSTVNAPGSALYGMGWVVDERGGQRFVWRNGMLPGFHAMNALLPEQHVAVIVLSNADSASGTTVEPERLASRILSVLAPLESAHVENAIVRRATEWLDRIARVDIDRTQLTPTFSEYLSDRLVIQADLRSEGPLEAIVPVETFDQNGDTVYVFDVRFRSGSMRYELALSADGKIDGLVLQPTS